MRKYNKLVLCICLIVVAVLGFALVKVIVNQGNTQNVTETKTPPEYTWEEYQALSLEEQDAFYLWFDSESAFEEWMEAVKPAEEEIDIPSWNKSDKLPSEYTWEEYQALSLEEQDAFYLWFDSESAFEEWVKAVKPAEEETDIPSWNKSDKLPSEYTWEEYQALSVEEREAFSLWFGSLQNFETWMNRVKPEESAPPVAEWDKLGKRPDEYTWAEYQALSLEEQEMFYIWFGSVRNFEAWMESAKSAEDIVIEMKWDKPGKKPNEYTWEEYQALTYEDQDAFYRWFGSLEAFEAWMKEAKTSGDASDESWNKPGKTPDKYTWEEYQLLTPQEQDAFYRWFGSLEAFEAWMEEVKKSGDASDEGWNKPGKTPDKYTWEEYQLLTPQEQDAFYQWFGSLEAFETWMENAKTDTGVSNGPVWNKPGKLPDQYTKEEYLALTPEEQEAFFLWFDSLESFEEWVESTQSQESN